MPADDTQPQHALEILRPLGKLFRPVQESDWALKRMLGWMLARQGDTLERISLTAEQWATLNVYQRGLSDPPRPLPNCEWCDSCEAYVHGSKRCKGCDKCFECETTICADGCERCQDCCLCTRCDKCGETVDNRCDSCLRGIECCCACVRCNNCSEVRDDYYCSDCENCNNCCQCTRCNDCGEVRDEDDLCRECHQCRRRTVTRNGRSRRTGCCECGGGCYEIEHDVKLHTDSDQRMAGLEVEIEAVSNFQPIKDWATRWSASVHEDTSCGWEAVTAPAAGQRLAGQLDDLGVAIDQSRAVDNEHCGVHVHVDARDLNLQAIRRLAIVYGHLEPILFAIAGANRTRNHYCKPNGKRLSEAAKAPNWAGELMHGIYKAAYSKEAALNDLRGWARRKSADKKDGSRYAALNLCPWVAGKINRKPDTTVEFRLHENCIDTKRLLSWAKICIALVDYAKVATFADATSLHKSALRALIAICPEERAFIMSRIRAWRRSKTDNSVKYHLGVWSVM